MRTARKISQRLKLVRYSLNVDGRLYVPPALPQEDSDWAENTEHKTDYASETKVGINTTLVWDQPDRYLKTLFLNAFRINKRMQYGIYRINRAIRHCRTSWNQDQWIWHYPFTRTYIFKKVRCKVAKVRSEGVAVVVKDTHTKHVNIMKIWWYIFVKIRALFTMHYQVCYFYFIKEFKVLDFVICTQMRIIQFQYVFL